MSSPSTHSGPHPPQGSRLDPELRAEVTVKSGPHPPQGGLPVGSGPHPPQGAFPAVPNAAAGTAAAQAAEPKPATREETVSVRLLIPKPEPFSVFLVSPDRNDLQIQSLEIEICDRERAVFTAAVSTDLPLVLNKPAEAHVYPFSEEQLARILPHLQIGNSVEVTIYYWAPTQSQVTIGIIARESHHRLGRFIEHVLR